jgi:hypothetical protein
MATLQQLSCMPFLGLVQRSVPQQSVAAPNRILTPRAPTVHLFVCDYRNIKVKNLTDQFLEQLCGQGVKVFTEKYVAHHPGFQVRAASMNSTADFFFQIHSKTATSNRVRIYEQGHPRRMAVSESVAWVWAWWRAKCGALSKEEISVISSEKISLLLKNFVGLDEKELGIEDLQKRIRTIIELGQNPEDVMERIKEVEGILMEARVRVATYTPIAIDWAKEPGAQLQSCPDLPIVSGLSQPVKDFLNQVIEKAVIKLYGLEKIVADYTARGTFADNDGFEIPVGDGDRMVSVDSGREIGSWRMMIESMDEDRYIRSFGENRGSVSGEFSVAAEHLISLDGY